MKLTTSPKDHARRYTLSRDLGFHALKSLSFEDGVQVMKIHVTMDLEEFNWDQHQLFRTYLKSVRTEILQGQRIDVIWYYSESDEESFEMGRDYAELLEMDFVFVAREVLP